MKPISNRGEAAQEYKSFAAVNSLDWFSGLEKYDNGRITRILRIDKKRVFGAVALWISLIAGSISIMQVII